MIEGKRARRTFIKAMESSLRWRSRAGFYSEAFIWGPSKRFRDSWTPPANFSG